MREGLGRVAEHGSTSWGEELARLVADLADPGRHDRGLVLLEEGAVGRVSVTRGCFAATVHGASGREHAAQVRVRALPRDDAARLFRVLLDDPGLLASLLQGLAGTAGAPTARRVARGALPAAAAELTEDDVEFVCSCPDPDPVCKHVVALALTVADLADDSPASWLQARGVPLEGLTRGGRALVVVPELAAPAAEEPDAAQAHFGGAGGAPVLPTAGRGVPAAAAGAGPARGARARGARRRRARGGLRGADAVLTGGAPVRASGQGGRARRPPGRAGAPPSRAGAPRRPTRAPLTLRSQAVTEVVR
jgi:uncharacterized Zn finger protein